MEHTGAVAMEDSKGEGLPSLNSVCVCEFLCHWVQEKQLRRPIKVTDLTNEYEGRGAGARDRK